MKHWGVCELLERVPGKSTEVVSFRKHLQEAGELSGRTVHHLGEESPRQRQ